MTCVPLRDFCWTRTVTFGKEVRSEFNGIEAETEKHPLPQDLKDF
jgi:hypothetical protein